MFQNSTWRVMNNPTSRFMAESIRRSIYPFEHYSYSAYSASGPRTSRGAFGENFTTEGLLESRIQIGERLSAGSCEFVVTQPRMPASSSGFDSIAPTWLSDLKSKRSGFYVAVVREGDVAAGDPIESIDRPEEQPDNCGHRGSLHGGFPRPGSSGRAADLPALPEGWKEHFRQRLAAQASSVPPTT